MQSVLFVCTANINRSPISTALFRKKVEGIVPEKDWNIESAGTWTVEGIPAARGVREVLGELGLDVSGHRSRSVSQELLQDFNLILTMEMGQKEALQFEFPEIAKRVFMLSEMVGAIENVTDPVGGSIRDYQATADEIDNYLTEGFDKICRLA